MMSRILLVMVLTTTLAACKIVVNTPEGGGVESRSGRHVCGADTSCTVDVPDSNFYESFDAVAEPGYSFNQWREAPGYFCGGSSRRCTLDAGYMRGNDILEEVKAKLSIQ